MSEDENIIEDDETCPECLLPLDECTCDSEYDEDKSEDE